MRERLFTDDFLDFEDQFNLFDLRFSNVNIWDYVRYSVYLEILAKKSKNSSNTSLKANPISSIYRLIKSMWNVLLQPRRHKISLKKDITILGHPRKSLESGFYVDKYCEDLMISLREKYSISMLDLPFKMEHFNTKEKGASQYLDYYEHMFIFAPFLKRLTLTPEEKEVLFQLETELNKQFNVRVNLSKQIITALKRYLVLRKKIERLFQQSETKCIVCVDGYNFIKKVFIEIANSKQIPTIELQHGTIGYFHLGYRYPSHIVDIQSFPKHLLLWGEYWERFIQLPKKSSSRVVGFPYLEKRYQPLETSSRTILVISQWTIGFNLLKEVQAIAASLPEYQFLFKLHPNEENNLKSYEELIHTDNLKIAPLDKHLYDLFNHSIAQIGVYSTALIEGIAFHLKTFIIPLYGHEAFDDLVEENLMVKTKDPKVILDYLSSKVSSVESHRKIWEPDALKKSSIQIEKIINES